MKKHLLLLLCMFTVATGFAQDRYVVFFTDKNNSPYSVGNPSAYLSARAIQRRQAQNIAVTQQDFPVNPAYLTGVAGTGATILNTSRWFNSVTVEVANPGVLTAINALPYVASST
ncbi:MAG: hypothetical protein IPL22_18910 [Bacteroidetes bacterium]|nr:hypothetical protein [Bacteroidota bacterium]